MKSILKIFFISIICCIATIVTYDFFKKSSYDKNNKNTLENRKVIPNYVSFNSDSRSNSDSEKTDFTIAAEKTINSVVHIKNTSNYREDSDSWLYRLYGQSTPKRIGNGSGVIVSPDGYIITNDHVIKDASEIEITTNDNKTYIANLVGTDPYTDIAILKINSNKSLNYIPFGDSESLKIGEWVLALGNPFNLNSTVTAGIVSAKSRDLNQMDRKNQSFIQTDAAVNQGNSGGALINTKGELIGINTAISSITGGFVGYSFAVPSNLARKVFEDILEFGNVQKGLLGVSGNALNQNLAKKLNINETEGFYVNNVEPNLGAEKAGIKTKDIITKIDFVKINKFSDMSGYLSTKRPGDVINVEYIRDKKKFNTKVVLKKITRTIFLGMELRNTEKSDISIINNNTAVKVTNVENSRLNRMGIDKGYYILKINEIEIKDISQIERIDVESLNSILFMSPNGEKERIIFE